jgi:2-polyprenyl-3-methyl-5-hydroxy-6-metoxy-1,4-benzoquinol methylase
MSVLTISSLNPNFSHVIAKNPNTIREAKTPFVRELRAGKVYGWFVDEKNSQFRLLFIDANASSSFAKNPEFEYLDMTRYSDPYLVIMMISMTLATALKTNAADDNFPCSIDFTINCPERLIKKFENMMEDSCFVAGKLKTSNSFWNIKLSGNSVSHALNMVCTICAIVAVSSFDNPIPLPEAGIVKYLNILNKADADYYLRHLFVSRAISNRDLFAKLKPQIDTDTIKLSYGNTQVQRLYSIKSSLANAKRASNIVDIGCGEMSQSMKLLELYNFLMGIDADPEIVESCTHRIRKKNIENATVICEKVTGKWLLDNSSMFDNSDFLLSEVIEHMPITEARDIIVAVLQLSSNNVIITVPNKSFNKHYGLSDSEMRHPEHVWEPTFDQFKKLIDSCIEQVGVTVNTIYKPCGDVVIDADGQQNPSTWQVQINKA